MVPTVATFAGTGVTLVLLGIGTIFYAYAESRRRAGHSVWLVSRITELSSRSRDADRYVLGPITLGIGSMLALLLYPNPAATIAIYALAFGDGLASVAGKLFGHIRIPGTGGKTLEGSLTCASAVAISAYLVYPSPAVAVVSALSAACLEALPTGDADNLILPVGVGLAISFVV